MKLSFLLSPLNLGISYSDIEVSSLCLHTDRVKDGAVFISLAQDKKQKKSNDDAAISKGAKVVLYNEDFSTTYEDRGCIFIGVKDLRLYLETLLSRLYSNASKMKHYIGITGTNGKTTVANWSSYIAKTQGVELGVIGTLGTTFSNIKVSTGLTSPDISTTYSILNEMYLNEVDGCALEVSSHGLVQGRASGVPISVGVFTSFSQDHLDYHGSMDNYFKAKTKLFEDYNLKYAIFNIDDDRIRSYLEGGYMGNALVIGYTLNDENKCSRCDLIISASKICYESAKVDFTLNYKNKSKRCSIPTSGHYNLLNALAVFSISYSLGLDVEKAANALSSLPMVPGRFEIVKTSKTELLPSVIIDFAHTPDGLTNVLSAVKPNCKGRLFVVFGCGGDRDRDKRAPMLDSVQQFADEIFITQDNSRTESFEQILDDILSEQKKDDKRIKVVQDRRNAICHAIEVANSNDTVVIAGRGHETVQDLGNVKLEYKDIDIVHKEFSRLERRILVSEN